jgi:heme-degrading monooxygenase HmoA
MKEVPMGEIYTTGRWRVSAGNEQKFVEAWAEFAAWASETSGAGELRLARDRREEELFVSFGAWASADAVRGWKSAPEFRERLAHVLEHVDEFEPSELAVVATAKAATAATYN